MKLGAAMDDELTAEQLFWLDRLITVRHGESAGKIPLEVRNALLAREFARFGGGQLGITFDGIRYLMAQL